MKRNTLCLNKENIEKHGELNEGKREIKERREEWG